MNLSTTFDSGYALIDLGPIGVWQSGFDLHRKPCQTEEPKLTSLVGIVLSHARGKKTLNPKSPLQLPLPLLLLRRLLCRLLRRLQGRLLLPLLLLYSYCYCYCYRHCYCCCCCCYCCYYCSGCSGCGCGCCCCCCCCCCSYCSYLHYYADAGHDVVYDCGLGLTTTMTTTVTAICGLTRPDASMVHQEDWRTRTRIIFRR